MKNTGFCVSVCVVVLLVILGLSGCSSSGGGGEVTTPTGLAAVANPSATEISLSWAGSLPAGAKFLVFRGTASGSESSTPVGVSSTTSYTDADPTLQPTTCYYYYVVAATTAVQSSHSNEASAITVDAGSVDITVQ